MFKKANWGTVLMVLCLFAACTKPNNENNNEGGDNNDTIINGGDNNDTIINGGDTLVNTIPVGAINSLFTINENGDKVYFSQGNLQYQASTNTFQFAKTQLEYIGWLNSRISPTYDGWIDLFGWGTSGWDCGHPYYHPWDYEPSSYGPVGNDLTGEYANSDWGVYNPIINGGNEASLWRTLTQPEWETLLMTRQTPSGIRYVKATIGENTGLLIIPDDWDAETYNFINPNLYESYFSDNLLTEDDWNNIVEPAGVVFLPTAGVRSEKTVCETTKTGNY